VLEKVLLAEKRPVPIKNLLPTKRRLLENDPDLTNLEVDEKPIVVFTVAVLVNGLVRPNELVELPKALREIRSVGENLPWL
jgi:hypothetical protein